MSPLRVISIHAPLAGRDVAAAALFRQSLPISIHAPLAGRDKPCTNVQSIDKIFQSTRPLRGATRASGATARMKRFQSTRPLRGATANVHKKYVHVCENRQKKLFSLPNAVCQSA